MNAKFPGLLIRRERLKKGWSQEGLCRGICAVSYLSKIEQGKAEASEDISSLLLQRLGIHWKTDPALTERAFQLTEQLYDAVFSMERERVRTLQESFQNERDALFQGPTMLDFLLLEGILTESPLEELSEFVSAMDKRQYGIWLYLSKAYDELLKGWPSSFYFIEAGFNDYHRGNYTLAIERLQRGYELASQAGAVYAMLQAALTIGNCYSDLNQFALMRSHYEAAERIARALGDFDTLESIRYNIASTNLEFGHTAEAYEYFQKLDNPNVMSCHKLAVCCELLGKTQEALAALEKAENAPCTFPERSMAMEICSLVRFRLEHPNYLKIPEYGIMLLDCFSRMRTELPMGYARFHLGRVEEWYRSGRQYKQICELLKDFPATPQ